MTPVTPNDPMVFRMNFHLFLSGTSWIFIPSTKGRPKSGPAGGMADLPAADGEDLPPEPNHAQGVDSARHMS